MSGYNHGRVLSRAEVYRGMVWVLKDISGTLMTPDQINREKIFRMRRQQLEDKRREIEFNKHVDFVNNKLNSSGLVGCSQQKFPSKFQVIDNALDSTVPDIPNCRLVTLSRRKVRWF